MFVKSAENFEDAFEKQFQIKILEVVKIFQTHFELRLMLFFFWEWFFSNVSWKCSATLRTCSRHLKRPLNLVVYFSKKNHERTTHQSHYILGKVKKVEILKKWSSKSAWNILTKPHFLGWNFFSKASRKFSIGLTNMFKVSERSA